MIYTRSLCSKIFFTCIILILYVIFRLIKIPGILIEESILNDGSVFLFAANVFSGYSLSKYSIFALNITPILITLGVLQLVSVWLSSTQLYSQQYVMEKLDSLFSIIFVIISFISSLLYIQYIDLGIISVCKNNPILYATHLVCVLVLLMIGSFFILYLIRYINTLGVGKGFSWIILINLLISLYNIYENIVNILHHQCIMLLVQCVVCAFLVYLLEYTYIMMPISEKSSIFSTYLVEKDFTSQTKLKTSLSTLGIFPIIVANGLYLLKINIADTCYSIIINLLIEILIIYFICMLSSQILRKISKYVQYIDNKNISLQYLARIVDTYCLFRNYTLNIWLKEFSVLVLITVFSKITYILYTILYFMGTFECDAFFYNAYTTNNQLMFIYIICIRLLLLLWFKSELMYAHNRRNVRV